MLCSNIHYFNQCCKLLLLLFKVASALIVFWFNLIIEIDFMNCIQTPNDCYCLAKSTMNQKFMESRILRIEIAEMEIETSVRTETFDSNFGLTASKTLPKTFGFYWFCSPAPRFSNSLTLPIIRWSTFKYCSPMTFTQRQKFASDFCDSVIMRSCLTALAFPIQIHGVCLCMRSAMLWRCLLLFTL